MPRPAHQQGNLTEGFKKLRRRKAWTLEHKIEHANRLIARVLRNHKHPIVCWSGGKDSTVLLHLVLQQAPKIQIIFNDTGVEFPETRAYVDLISRRWRIRRQLHIARPKKGETFWEITKEHGWPLMGKEQSANIESARRRLKKQIHAGDVEEPDFRIPLIGDIVPNGTGHNGKNGRNGADLNELAGFDKLSDMERVLVSYDVDISTRCCEFLKERPTKALETALGVDCKILGLMASESRRRTLLWIDHGEYYRVKHYYGRNKGVWKALPMALWTEEDVWEYHRRYRIPHAAIYDKGHDRNGCWTCGMGAKFGQFKRLRESHPQLFNHLMTRTDMGRELLRAKVAVNTRNIDVFEAEEWAEDVDISHLLVQRPCFFDEF